MTNPCNQTTEVIAVDIERHKRNPSQGWLSIMAEAYTIRSGLYYSRRRRFDDALRPITAGGAPIAYPDAVYHLTQADLDRAKEAIGHE
jgi:hypothetical protein